MNIIILNPDANSATSCTGRNVIARPIAIPVPIMAQCGVPYLPCTLSRNLGISLSLDIAKGNLEDARIPASAIEVIVITARIAAIFPTVSPPTASAKMYTGSSLAPCSPPCMYSVGSTAAAMTIVTET